jgi:hypothetical protein
MSSCRGSSAALHGEALPSLVDVTLFPALASAASRLNGTGTGPERPGANDFGSDAARTLSGIAFNHQGSAA